MKCPYCNGEMDKGYIVSDGRSVAWRREKFESAWVGRGSDGVQLERKFMGACCFEAYCCKRCEKIVIDYSGEDDSDELVKSL